MIRIFRSAWEPLTPRGIAAFARVSPRRLWFVQFIVACILAATVVWWLHRGVFPIVDAAVEKLPETGVIRNATLDWNGKSPAILAEGRFISFAVDLSHDGGARTPAHFQVEFGHENFIVCSLFGCAQFRYPTQWWIAFNRTEVLPKWGAWEKPALALAAAFVILWLMLTWQLIAAVYAAPVWLIGYFTNRRLTFGGSYKLAGAALMPGSAWMIVCIALYEQRALDLVTMAFAVAAHFVIGWIYLAIAPWFVPQAAEAAATSKNPFAK